MNIDNNNSIADYDPFSENIEPEGSLARTQAGGDVDVASLPRENKPYGPGIILIGKDQIDKSPSDLRAIAKAYNIFRLIEEESLVDNIENIAVVEELSLNLDDLDCDEGLLKNEKIIQLAIKSELVLRSKSNPDLFQFSEGQMEKLKQRKITHIEARLAGGKVELIREARIQTMSGAMSSALARSVEQFAMALANARLREEQKRREKLESKPPHHSLLSDSKKEGIKATISRFHLCFVPVDKKFSSVEAEILRKTIDAADEEYEEEKELNKEESQKKEIIKQEINKFSLKNEIDGKIKQMKFVRKRNRPL